MLNKVDETERCHVLSHNSCAAPNGSTVHPGRVDRSLRVANSYSTIPYEIHTRALPTYCLGFTCLTCCQGFNSTRMRYRISAGRFTTPRSIIVRQGNRKWQHHIPHEAGSSNPAYQETISSQELLINQRNESRTKLI